MWRVLLGCTGRSAEEERQALNTHSVCKVSSLYSSENVCSMEFIWYK